MKRMLIAAAVFFGQAATFTAFAFESPKTQKAEAKPPHGSPDRTVAKSRSDEAAAKDLGREGYRLFQANQYDAAIELFSKAISLAPTLKDAYLYRGIAYDQKNELDKAFADFNRAVELAPADSDCLFRRGSVHLQNKECAAALADFNAAIEHAPAGIAVDNASAAAALYRNRGRTWFYLGEADKSLADLDEAIRLDPKKAAAYRFRGELLMAIRQYERAIQDLSRAIELDSHDSWSASSRAALYFLKGEYDKGIADCNEAIRRDPQNSDAYQNRGAVRLIKSEFDASIIDSAKAIELTAGKEALPLENRAFALMFKDECEPAIRDLDAALRVAPNDEDACAALVFLLAASTDERCRDGQRALELGRRLCKQAGYNDITLDILGMAYAETSEFAMAVECTESALRNFKSAQTHPALREGLEQRIAIYRAGRPYRAKASAWIRDHANPKDAAHAPGQGADSCFRTNFGLKSR